MTENTPAFFSISKIWKYALILFSGLILLASIASVVWKPQRIMPAPDVTFVTLHGEKLTLKNLRGKPVLVTFWATDCPSCVKEVSDFTDLYQQFHAKGLEIIAAAMAYDPPNHVLEMTQAKQIPYHVALDLRAEHALAFGKIEFTPTTFLINQAGQIVFSKIGLFEMEEMKQRLQQLLQGAA